MLSGYPTGTISSYKNGSKEFDALLQLSGQAKGLKSEYSITGNKLTLKTDLNNNGDYSDDNETTIYTRQ